MRPSRPWHGSDENMIARKRSVHQRFVVRRLLGECIRLLRGDVLGGYGANHRVRAALAALGLELRLILLRIRNVDLLRRGGGHLTAHGFDRLDRLRLSLELCQAARGVGSFGLLREGQAFRAIVDLHSTAQPCKIGSAPIPRTGFAEGWAIAMPGAG